eukprot:152170-Prymnesium_polylepis.2
MASARARSFMPLPIVSDPFLLRWCERDAKWWHSDDCIELQLIGPQSLTRREVMSMGAAEKVTLKWHVP